ncbi:MAG: YicC/YloC family endoribonuclease [Myxococcota bacterium]|nr:YicC/YloC family endoribonuclease [Myxococcota bacterium]
MVRSMTGFGAATTEEAGIAVSIEAKSVNGRFLKASIKLPSGLSRYEAALEGVIREVVARGSVSLSVFVEQTDAAALVSVNEDVAKAYQNVFEGLGLGPQNIAQLPGVIDPRRSLELAEEHWGVVEATARRALAAMVGMRESEGARLSEIVGSLCDSMEELRSRIAERAPRVALEYQGKLSERVEALLDGSGVAPDPQLLAREVALFADRADISEEIDRLGAHLAQIDEKLSEGREVGRSLDFLAQELLRETNTIGSKSSDEQVTRGVIELKGEVERFKEQVANIE